jgi:hypothetical protein
MGRFHKKKIFLSKAIKEERMNLKTMIESYDNGTLDEAAKGKDMDKLVTFLNKVSNGKVSQQGMLAAGFNMRNPSGNNEDRIAEALGVRLNINITEDDLREALKEIRIKSASDLVANWNDTQGRKQRRSEKISLEGSKGQKRF